MNLERGANEYYLQVSENLKGLFNLTTRIDERVKMVMKKQEDLEKKLDKQLSTRSEMDSRIKILESKNGKEADISSMKQDIHTLDVRVKAVEITADRQEGKWKTVIGFTIQIVWVLLAAYLLMKLGLQAPSLP